MLSAMVAVVASLASAAVASPDLLPHQAETVFAKRAGDRSPQSIICHKNCGYTILGASKEGYCKDQGWGNLQAKCNECAPKYDNIAEQYHEDLQKALTPCGLQAPPTSSGGEQVSGNTSSSAASPSAASSSVAGPSSSISGGQATSATGMQPTSAHQESSAATAASSNLSPTRVVSATSVSVTGGAASDASAAARPSGTTGDARSSHAVALGSLVTALAVLFVTAML